MEKILKDILDELKYQTRIMEYLYEKKDEKQHGFSDYMKNMRSVILNNPMFAAAPEAKAMLEDMFKRLEVGK